MSQTPPPALPASLQLIPNITVTIDADDYVAVNELTGEEVIREPFGPDFAGDITIKDLSIYAEVEIPSIVTAALQRMNVLEPGGMPAATYRLLQALAWFQVLGVARPAWLSEAVSSTEKRKAAIIFAYDKTKAKLEAAKKNSGSAGENGSPKS